MPIYKIKVSEDKLYIRSLLITKEMATRRL